MPGLECVALVAVGLEVVETVGAAVDFGDYVIAVGCRCCASHAKRRTSKD